MTGFVFSKNSLYDNAIVQTAKPSSSASFSAWRHFVPFDYVAGTNSGNLLVCVSITGNFTNDYNNSSDPTWGSGIEFYPMITLVKNQQTDGALDSSIRSWSDGRKINISPGFTQGSGYQLPPPQTMFMDVFTGLPRDTDLYIHIVARSYGYNTPIIGRTLFTMPV